MIFKIFVFFKIIATVLPKNNPKPFFLSKCIDFDSFSWQNNENSPNSKNCPKLRGLLPVALEVLPKTEHGNFLCLLYRFIFHCQFAAVSPRKKVRQYGVKFYRVHRLEEDAWSRLPFPIAVKRWLTEPKKIPPFSSYFGQISHLLAYPVKITIKLAKIVPMQSPKFLFIIYHLRTIWQILYIQIPTL